jgi:hypothetical protein
MKSRAGEIYIEDVLKGIKVFLWNFGSLVGAILIAIFALPQEQLPQELLWLVPLAPALNATIYTIARWQKDNNVEE